MKSITTIVLILFSFAAFNQSKFQVGVESGAGLAMSFKNAPLTKPSISIIDGATFQYNISRFFSFKTGLYYERKGWRTKNPLTDINGSDIGEVKGKNHVHYLSIPLLLKASFGNKIKFFANAGLGLGFLTGAVSKFKFNTNYNLDSNLYPEKRSFTKLVDKKFDLGAIFGLGLEIPIKDKFSFNVEARNNFGIRTLFGSGRNSIIRLNTTNLLLGFSYKFGKKEK